jgi:hypothetical protein
VRIEGVKKTLVATKTVKTGTGTITKDGAKCPANGAGGALNAATHGNWGGQNTSFGLELTSILGETYTFTGSKYFWEIFVDNAPASVGLCDQKVKPGDSLVFAAVPQKGMHYMTGIKAPKSAKAGKPFKVTVVIYGPKGKPKPLAKAPVRFGKVAVLTNAHGTATLKVTKPGRITLHSATKGEVRAAPVTVRVTA